MYINLCINHLLFTLKFKENMKRILLSLVLVAFIVQNMFAWSTPQSRNYNGSSSPEQPSTLYVGDTGSFGCDSWSNLDGQWADWKIVIHTSSDVSNGTYGTQSATQNIQHMTGTSPRFTSTGTWYWGIQVHYGSAGYDWYCRNDANWYNMWGTPTSNLSVTVSALSNPTLGTLTSTTSSITIPITEWNSKYVTILRNTVNDFTDPTQGTSYTVGAVINSKATVVAANSSTTSFVDSPLTPGTTYYYKIYSNNNNYYSGGVSANIATVAAPIITSIMSSLPSFSSTQTYKGATVTVTGTNLSAITAIKLGGVTGTSITTSSPTQIGNATSLNFVVPDGTSGGTIYVSDGTNSATSSGSLTNLGFISTNSSNWSVGSTWLGGTVPTATDNVSIAHGTSVMLDGDKTVANFTINSTTGNFSNSTYTLTIAANGTLTNNNSGNGFTRNSGTVSFAGTGTIVGTIGFNNVTIAGGVNFGSASTINGTLQINAGGYVNTNAPTYASGSTLKYYSATTYGRGTEWSTTTGAGYPYHVQISNNTILDMGANSGTGTARQCAGNLTVDAGSTFSMNATAMSAAVTVIGNVVNNGTITLSGTSGGDLKTQGNINDSGTFNANNRAIFFNGGNTQVIQGTGVFDISYVRINKTGGSVQLATDLTCAGPNGGNAMEIDGTSSILDLNGHTLYLGQSSTASTYNSGIATPGSIKGSSSSNISILGTGALGTLNFTSGSQTLNNLSIDRQTSGTVTLGSVLTVNGQLSLTNGTLSNSTNLTLGNGATVVRSVGTLASVPTFGSSVNLTYSGSATKGNEFPATDIINTLTANNTAGITLADNRNIPNLSIGTGSSLTVNAGKQLTVSTTMSNSGTLNLLSTSADGTATIITPTTITNSSSTYHVYQYLSGARNWYLSSPVSTATASANYTYYVRNEGANSWPVVSTGTSLAVGTGYIANLATGTSTIDFTGGTLNSNATIPVTLTRHAGVTKEGFNLVGNPYPAHVTLTKTITDAANALNTIWYRTTTWDGSKYIYAFSTCLMNQDGTFLSTPFGTSTNIVAPMQAFWVRANAGGGTLTFASTMRSHESSNPLKAPAKMNVTQQILRLQVTNSSLVSDEAVVYFNSNASNEFDNYDSPKMANLISSFPEIYTLSSSSTEQLAINGLNSVPYDVELPIGFTTGETNTFTIKASEFSNFDSGVKVYLVDKLLNKETELTVSDYTFNSDIAASTTRFSLIFKAPSVATGINSNTDNSDMLVYKNMNNQITVKCGGALNSESTVAVYNGVGQRLVSEKLKSNVTLLANRLSSGVYMVTVTNGSKMLTKKLVVD